MSVNPSKAKMEGLTDIISIFNKDNSILNNNYNLAASFHYLLVWRRRVDRATADKERRESKKAESEVVVELRLNVLILAGKPRNGKRRKRKSPVGTGKVEVVSKGKATIA